MADLVTRQMLRARTVAQLIAADVAGGNVAGSRWKPLRQDMLPQALVYTARESGANPTSDGPPKFDTIIELVIDLVIDGDDEGDVDNELDALIDAALSATLENADWVTGLENVTALDIVKNPLGPDGKPVAGGARIQMQISVGLVTYAPDITTPFTGADGKPVGDREFGVDINGDGTSEIDVQFNPPN